MRVDGSAIPAAAGHPPGAAGLPGVRNVRRQGLVQFLAVRHAQVDLIADAIKTEADSAFGLAAVDIVDEDSLYRTFRFPDLALLRRSK